ncbi:MAG: transcriptional regulator, TetR family [Myxococcaceae bacterium]|nr:transcriptional regulator, TetR family [Myxococcaceae bacterium]
MTKGEETKREILDHALRLASELGVQGLSIGTLASRVGMSKSGLFAHFSSKDNLQVAVIEEASRRFIEMVVAPALRKPRGEPRVRALLAHWVDWSKQDFMPGGCVFLAAAAELDDRPGPARDQLVSNQRDWLETLAQAARIARNEGHFRRDLNPEQFAFEALGAFSAYAFYTRLLEASDAEARVRAALGRLLDDARVQGVSPRARKSGKSSLST